VFVRFAFVLSAMRYHERETIVSRFCGNTLSDRVDWRERATQFPARCLCVVRVILDMFAAFISNNKMHRKIQRIYADTSVVLGMFDPDETRREQTAMFWDAVQSGEIVAVLSSVFAAELKDTSGRAWAFLNSLPQSHIKRIEPTVESDNLARQYIDAKVISDKSLNDCRHVALATYNADGIVSWNLRDMVKRAEKYNNVNTAAKCRKIKIVTPNRYKEIFNDT